MKYLILIVFFALITDSCSFENNTKQQINPARNQTVKKSKQKEKNCKENFEKFITKFKHDSLFQKNRIHKGLKILIIDSYEMDTLIETWQPEFIDFNNHTNQKIDAYKFQLKIKNDTAYYIQKGIDNGIFITYLFYKQNGCWYLQKIIDESS